MELKFDHIIHYMDYLEQFSFPGNILKIVTGGKHQQLGTFNRLSYIKHNYIELLGVEDVDLLKKVAKTTEGRVSFAAQIVQDRFVQGFKTMCFRTQNMEQLKQQLIERNVEVIGPVNMERKDHEGNQLKWQLLYIDNPQDSVKPPFFIQWEDTEAMYDERFKDLYQTQFSIEMIIMSSDQRERTVQHWQTWFDADVVDKQEYYTDIILKHDDIYFRIEDGKENRYHTMVIKDAQTTAPYSLAIKGAEYRFEPLD